MAGNIDSLSKAEAASLVGWWLEAGVDGAVAEQPRDWLKAAPPPVVATQGLVEAPPESMPDSFAAFDAWLATASGLPLDRPGAIRVAANGPVEAEVMLICDVPAREDAAEGKPIGGAAWQLTTRMLRAAGIDPAQCRSAALAGFHLAAARLEGDELTRCGEIMRRHIALARPKRLLLLGEAPVRALLGQPLVAARGKVHHIDGVAAVATFHPRFLMTRPADKALAWRDLLLLTEPVAT